MQVKPNSLSYRTADSDSKNSAQSSVKKGVSTDNKKQEKTPSRITDQIYARFAENEVTLSSQAKKLSEISQKFFSGIIKSEDIPSLKQRLFEEGFISDKEYASMGGKPEKVRALKQAIDFTRGYSETLKKTDLDAFKAMQGVIKVLQGMSQTPSNVSEKEKKAAIQFLQAHAKMLKDKQAPADIQSSIKKVLEQLTLSNTEQANTQKNGGVNSYANIQNTAK